MQCLEYRNLYENKIFFFIITSSYLVYIFVDCSEAESCLHLRKKSCHLLEAFHVMYNVQLNNKCENELMG